MRPRSWPATASCSRPPTSKTGACACAASWARKRRPCRPRWRWKCAPFSSSNLDWLAKTIVDGERAGLLRVRGGAEAQAYGLLSTLEGAMMVGRGFGSDHSPALAGTTYVSNMLV